MKSIMEVVMTEKNPLNVQVPMSICKHIPTTSKKNPSSTIGMLKVLNTGTTLNLGTAGTGTNLHVHGATISEHLKSPPALMLVIMMKDHLQYIALKLVCRIKCATALLMMNGSSQITTTLNPSTIQNGHGELMKMNGIYGMNSMICGSLDQTLLISIRFQEIELLLSE